MKNILSLEICMMEKIKLNNDRVIFWTCNLFESVGVLQTRRLLSLNCSIKSFKIILLKPKHPWNRPKNVAYLYRYQRIMEVIWADFLLIFYWLETINDFAISYLAKTSANANGKT